MAAHKKYANAEECRIARLKRNSERYHSDPEYRAKRKAVEAARYKNNPELRARAIARSAGRKQNLSPEAKAKYKENRFRKHGPSGGTSGWKSEEFESAWSLQGGRCLICGGVMVRGGLEGDTGVADHCHYTGKRRGIIHRSCNSGIGMLGDDPAILRHAIRYLESFE